MINKINKPVFFLEMFIKKPCKKCLIQACCTRECNDLYKWYQKHRFFIEINEIIIMIFGITIILMLAALNWVGIAKGKTTLTHVEKIEKFVENNIG